MSRILSLTLACLSLALMFVGCSGDNPTEPVDVRQVKTVIAGDIAPGTVSFEYSADAPGDPSPGQFTILGTNLHYEADPGVLLVDLVLVNESSMDFPGPIGLVFMELLPDSVTVLNADNGETGAGAVFNFAPDDSGMVWRAGTATGPRTVQFGVAAGTSLGFVAQITVGEDPAVGGVVAGMVWHDVNGNGEMDPDEVGVPGVPLILHAGAAPDSNAMIMHTVSREDGRYGFVALPAGHYTVALAPVEYFVPTTPPVIQILLVEYEGQVVDFLDAHFGIRLGVAPPDSSSCPEPGDCINAKGWYAADPDRLDTDILNVCDRLDDCLDACDCGGDGDCGDCVDCSCDGEGMGATCWGRLAGPITGVDGEQKAIAVMGTWVDLSELDWDKHEDDGDMVPGLRVRVNVRVEQGENGARLVACRMHRWHGHGDRVRGHVQEVVRSGNLFVGVRVLNTLVAVPEDFVCGDDGDDEDGEDEVR